MSADESHGHLRRRPAAWFLAATVLLILYASFYPFEFDWNRLAHAENGGFPSGLRWRHSTPGDALANLLFYIPFGALASFCLPLRLGRLARSAIAIAAGAVLSFCIEYAQHAARTRVPNLSDVAFNTVSTALGAYVALRAGVFMTRVRGPELRAARPDLAPLLLIGVWLALHAFPFIPRLGSHRLWIALTPLREFVLSSAGISAFVAGYLIVGAALRALLARRQFWQAFLAVALGSLSLRLLFTGQRLPLDECVGLLIALPCIGGLRALPHRRAAGPTALIALGAWLLHALAPPTALPLMPAYEWFPFLPVLERSFVHLGLLWLAGSYGVEIGRSTVPLLGMVLITAFIDYTLLAGAATAADLPLIAIAAVFVGAAARLARRQRPGGLAG
ncbi:MAG TPA: VanZ family protein [Steroidobacteraceae bacterium]